MNNRLKNPQGRKLTPKAKWFALTVLAVSVPVLASLPGGGPAEAFVNSTVAAWLATLSSTTTAAISALTASLTAAIETNTDAVTSALAVSVKQEAVSGAQIAAGKTDASKQLVAAIQSQKQAAAVVDATLNYGPTGQGYKMCQVLAENKQMDAGFNTLFSNSIQGATNLDNSSGRLSPTTITAINSRLESHRQNFCTQTEADAGLCTVSKLPGGDSNAALLFRPVVPGSLEAQARSDFRQNTMGPPDIAVSPSAGRTPAGQAYLMALNHKGALQSFPAYSLAFIDASNSQTIKDSAGNTVSPNQLLDETIQRYYGSDEAVKWQGTLMAQQPRGLLIEAAKMTGLQVWLHQQQYEQGQRILANLAALTIAAAQPIIDQTTAAQVRASDVDPGVARKRQAAGIQ